MSILNSLIAPMVTRLNFSKEILKKIGSILVGIVRKSIILITNMGSECVQKVKALYVLSVWGQK